nr:ribbon-helix-helix domain-containing protein [Pseudoflavonifractor sp. 524-17]
MLVNRIRLSTSLKKELAAQLDLVAQKSRIPKSRLLDEAVEDLLVKYSHLLQEDKK